MVANRSGFPIIGDAVTMIVCTGVFAATLVLALGFVLAEALNGSIGSAAAIAGNKANRLTLARAKVLRDISISEETRPVGPMAHDDGRAKTNNLAGVRACADIAGLLKSTKDLDAWRAAALPTVGDNAVGGR